MSGEIGERIEGLQLWIPSDSFKEPQNLNALEKAMPDLRAVSILQVPGEETIYCAGDRDGLVHHAVKPEDVDERKTELEKQTSAVTAATMPDIIISGHEGLKEEARMRELQLGLGRTSLFMASQAETQSDFIAAANDLKIVSLMLRQRVQPIERLSDTTLNANGLIYMFVKAARKHRSLSRNTAIELANAIDETIVPFPSATNRRQLETWGQARSRGFIDRVSFTQSPLVETSRPKPKKTPNKPSGETGHTLSPIAGSDLAKKAAREKKPYVKPPKTEQFIYRIAPDRSKIPFKAKLKKAHETYCGDNPTAFEIRKESVVELTQLGFEAYILTMQRRPGDAADQMKKYLDHKRNIHRPLLRMVVIGNLLAARVNASGGFRGELAEIPGLQAKNMPQAFKALRMFLAKNNHGRENDEARQIGDLVESYLDAAYAEGIELDSFEAIAAPSGFVTTEAYALRYNLSKSVLQGAIVDNGLNPPLYKFGNMERPGLSPDDQAILDSVVANLDKLPPVAPREVRTVGHLAVVTGAQSKRINELIEENDIETGLHLFRGRPARSLDIEAQKKLLILLGKDPAKYSRLFNPIK